MKLPVAVAANRVGTVFRLALRRRRDRSALSRDGSDRLSSCAMTLPGRLLLGSLRPRIRHQPGRLARLRVRRHGCIRRRLGCRRAAGRYRSRRGDDRRAHLRPLSRAHQPLGGRRPVRRAGPRPGLRRQGLRGLLDALRRRMARPLWWQRSSSGASTACASPRGRARPESVRAASTSKRGRRTTARSGSIPSGARWP